MENLITRHRNVSILVAVLFAQVMGLAVQVKRSGQTQETRLIQLWTVRAITPFEKVLVWFQQGTGNLWRNYVYLRGVRAENRELKEQIERMRLEQVRLSEDAEQARRLQLLLGFKEKTISRTVAAQVIGSSGSEQSRSVYIDKGSRNGVEPDQAVITADGIVGKVLRAFDSSALVLLISDQTSGLGVILEKTRVQGVLRGTAAGGVVVEKVLNDEAVQPGEHVISSGGDQIFPKGLDVGVVTRVTPGSNSFLNIEVKPAARLSKLEEVLVVTKIEDRSPAGESAGSVRAVDVLTRRLPSVPDKPASDPNSPGAATAGGGASKPASSVPEPKTQGPGTLPANTPPGVAPATATATQVPNKPGTAPDSKPPQVSSGASVSKSPAGASTVTGPPGIPVIGVKPTASVSGSQPVPKAATAVSKSADKNAKPATSQAEPAPVEDNPQ